MTTIWTGAKHLFTGAGREPAFGPRCRARSMAGLREQKSTRQNCDIVLSTQDGAQIWAHRFVLSAEYSGCDILFTADAKTPMQERQESVPPLRVNVTDLNSDMLGLLVDYAYGAPLEDLVGFHNVRQALQMAEDLKINKIRRHCTKMLWRNLAPDSCIGTYHLAVTKGYTSLAAEAYRCLVQNFREVWRDNAEFQSLTLHELRTILADNRLNAACEVDDCYHAIQKWISADVAERQKHLAHLLPFVRFVQSTIRECEEVVTDPRLQADENSVLVLNVIFQTLSRRSMTVGECAGVDLSARTWLTPRLQKGIIFVFGGMKNIYEKSNVMYTYNRRTRTWRNLGEQDTIPTVGHGMVALGSCIYIIGGTNGRKFCHSVMCFDVKRNQWSQKANLNLGRGYCTVAALNGLIYAMGGQYQLWSKFTSTVECYDPTSNQWSPVASMTEARANAAPAVARGRIYVIGGANYFQALSSVEYYDPSSDVWTQLAATLSVPRIDARAVAHEHEIYVMGGYVGILPLASMEKLDLRRGHFTDLPSMIEQRISFGAVLLEGYIYVMGGQKETPTEIVANTSLDRYDIRAGKWHLFEDPGAPCWHGGACVVYDVENPERYV